MKDIDFLPNRYRQQTTLRKARLWRFVVLLVFGIGIGATAVGQLALRRSAAARLQAIGPQYTTAKETSQLRERLLAQLAGVKDTARLYAYLNHPWPKTQLLWAVVNTLPPEIVISEMRIVRETPQAARRPRQVRRTVGNEQPSERDRLPPPQRDFVQLQEERNATRCVVLLKGLTSDLAALHAYQSKLSESTLITKADLISLESSKNENQSGALQFNLRLVVLPGYGNPSGPQAAGAAKPALASNVPGDPQQ